MICSFFKKLKLKRLKGKFIKLNHFKDADYWIGLSPKETAEALAIAWKNLPADGFRLLRRTQIETIFISSAWANAEELIAYVEHVNRLIGLGDVSAIEKAMNGFPKVAIRDLPDWVGDEKGNLQVADSLKTIAAAITYHRLTLEPYSLSINQRLCAPLYNELIQMYIYFITVLERECEYV